jgi:hypothetical protein
MDANERKMEELVAKVCGIADYTDTLNAIVNRADEIKSHLQKTSFAGQEVDILCDYLSSAIALLKRPINQKVIHHHHASTILWGTIILFMMECITIVGWYRAEENQSLYKAKDTKYRYLKLSANQSLYKTLVSLDTLYTKDEKMREHVIATEEQNEKNYQLMIRAIQMEKEAKQLKQQVEQEQGKQSVDSTRKAAKVHKRK